MELCKKYAFVDRPRTTALCAADDSAGKSARKGRKTLLNSSVLVVGAGGLGSPLVLYLAAAGVGRIGVVDGDRVDLSNLQRQILFETTDIGRAKVASVMDAIEDINPDIQIEAHDTRLINDNAANLIQHYDMVVDGCDSPGTRVLINAQCRKYGKVLVSAAVQGFVGQLATFKSHLEGAHPCYQCLYPSPPVEENQQCSGLGILGPVAGVAGAWQAVEVVKELLGIGESLSGSILRLDFLSGEVKKSRLPRDPACPCCGATVTNA